MAAEGAHDYSDMISGLRKVFGSGKTKSYEWRLGQLKAMHNMLKENEEELKSALKKDLNRGMFESLVFELAVLYADLADAIDNLHKWMKPTRVKRDMMTIMDDCYILPEPLGTVLIIAPWNYPIQLTLASMTGPIAAGNCVVVKPSEMAPACSDLVTRLITKYMDQECVRVVQGGVEETQALLEERFDKIMYTGSTSVGRVVMEAAAKHLTPVLLELGGKSPVYVDGNCDFDVVANRIIWGKCINSGQTCIAPDYVMCDKDTQVKLVESMRKSLMNFFGDDPKQTDDYSRMINPRHFERVKKLMESSGRVAIGGNYDASQKYISPTILTDVTLNDPIMQEEIFGPVLPIINVNNVDEAIDIINDREKPLTCYVFSKNHKLVEKVMERTSSGSFLCNDTIVMVSLLSLPFGGVGHSGMGSYHGKHSFDAFSHQKSVMIKSQGLESINRVRYPPFSEKRMRVIMNWLLKTKPSKRFSSFLPWFSALALLCLALFIGTR